MDALPFRELWAADFEFRHAAGLDRSYPENGGDLPQPVCAVFKELRTGRLLQFWQDELPSQPPFSVGPDALFISYVAQAELKCFLQLGWEMPARIIDLFVEFCETTNGLDLPLVGGKRRSLLAALSWHGIPGITSEEKTSLQDLARRGGPWTVTERTALLEYCAMDVHVLEPLLQRMLPSILRRRESLAHALFRGRFTPAVARMERDGIPTDTYRLDQLRRRWDAIKLDLIADIDRRYNCYDGSTFKIDRFEAYLVREGIPWKRTKTGQLALDRDTFKEAANIYPQMAPLRELRDSLSELRLEKLAVGSDGRNRASLWPFSARSSRNTPSGSKFVFGPSRWIRSLIRPEPDRGLAYIDWSAQEVVIAAALSGDQALLDAVATGDPYMRFAKLAGLAPDDATKQTHEQIRNLCKQCLLGSNYGMGVALLAQKTGTSLLVAQATQRALAQAFPTFWQWAKDMTDAGELYQELRTVFGWTLRVRQDTKSTSLRNFSMQANGAEMLRLACMLTTESGVQVDAPIHDALLIEAPSEEIGDAVATTRAKMSEAARVVLGGVDVATDVKMVCWPDRYTDPRGAVMWQRVTALLDREAERYGDSPADWPVIVAPSPLRRRRQKGAGERRGLTGMVRCSGCGQWVRPRPEIGDVEAKERAYSGDEWQEHYCPADFGEALDLASEEEREAWEAFEVEDAGQTT